MIRYRLPHDFDEYAFCKWCGASEMLIEDGRKPRYCAKNRKFKAPGLYVSYSSLERIAVEIVESDSGIPISFRVAPLVLDSLEPMFDRWSTPEIMKAFEKVLVAAGQDGVGLYSTAHPGAAPHLVDPDEWYIKDPEKHENGDGV